MGRFVETVEFLDLEDQFRVEPARAPVFSRYPGTAVGTGVFPGLAGGFAACRTANSGRGFDGGSFDAGDHLFHRPAGSRLHDDEIDHHDPE